MVKLQSEIEFVNHASVLVSYEGTNILSDPWYSGQAFHKGWNLLHESADEQVAELLQRVTHIWISHEHPDHFSIKFFKTHKQLIKSKNIEILFQKTEDKRVLHFLENEGLKVSELSFGKPHKISEFTSVICIKDGFYDSGLLIKNGAEKILNLNDCEVTNLKRAREVLKITGEVDVLLTQFSFAAWKGGIKNKAWRREAAKEKLSTMKLQISTFKPKAVIPFASFIYFSNELNHYLNDAVNSLADVDKFFKFRTFDLLLMQPGDVFGGDAEILNNEKAKRFWASQAAKASNGKLNEFESVTETALTEAFGEYCDRILRKNNLNLMRLIRKLSPVKAFHPVCVFLVDKDISVGFDYLNRKIEFGVSGEPMLLLHSESLHFLFKNGFGFDTLTVNACFEETPNGFVLATKTLAIENLNNLGVNISFRTLINLSIIKLFLVRLYRVAKKLEQ